MARRRSRKNTDAARRPAVTEPAEASTPAAPSEPSAAATKPAPAKAVPAGSKAKGAPACAESQPGPADPPQAPRGSGRWVRLSTCVAGMLLTLVLGLYLGTLLPGVLQDMRGAEIAGAPPRAPAVQAPPTAAAGAATAPAVTGQAGVPAAAPAVAGEPDAHRLPPELAAQLAALEGAVRKEPTSAANWAELGNLFFDAGRVREAINAYERSLALAPGNADVLTDLGIMYREDKAPEKAVECFRKALAADPRHENALFNAGVVLYTDLGRKDEAVASWRRLLGVNPHARAPDGRAVSEMVRRLEDPLRRQ